MRSKLFVLPIIALLVTLLLASAMITGFEVVQFQGVIICLIVSMVATTILRYAPKVFLKILGEMLD